MADDTDYTEEPNFILQVCSAICGIAELFNRKTYCQRSAPQNLIGHHLLALDRKESSLVVFTLCRLALMDTCCKATQGRTTG